VSYKPGQHIYLAAGFFTDKQKELCSFIESLEKPVAPIYSPRIDGGVLKPDSDAIEIEATFKSNTIAINVARFVLAVIDDYDPGVIWEMGYAHGKTGILAYSDVPDRGLNVMLAGSCNLGYINGRDDLGAFFKEYGEFMAGDIFPRNTWSGSIQ
jgi:hypothetical protein